MFSRKVLLPLIALWISASVTVPALAEETIDYDFQPVLSLIKKIRTAESVDEVTRLSAAYKKAFMYFYELRGDTEFERDPDEVATWPRWLQPSRPTQDLPPARLLGPAHFNGITPAKVYWFLRSYYSEEPDEDPDLLFLQIQRELVYEDPNMRDVAAALVSALKATTTVTEAEQILKSYCCNEASERAVFLRMNAVIDLPPHAQYALFDHVPVNWLIKEYTAARAELAECTEPNASEAQCEKLKTAMAVANVNLFIDNFLNDSGRPHLKLVQRASSVFHVGAFFATMFLQDYFTLAVIAYFFYRLQIEGPFPALHSAMRDNFKLASELGIVPTQRQVERFQAMSSDPAGRVYVGSLPSRYTRQCWKALLNGQIP